MVIATVMLTIIGMTGGYLLSERRGQPSSDAASPSVPDDSSSSGPALLPTDGLCPQKTQEMGAKSGAAGELGLVLEVATKSKTVVWICQDNAGRLFYHANKGGQSALWVEGKTALFLADVRDDGDGNFTATAAWDGTTFSVNRDRVLITSAAGKVTEQEAVSE
ncbi:hypothetical protein ADL15_44170 [Actinoplanes awajinensis subsp. mycoplanecinus]|uniref:Uncharacterized protein n=1 Tax=Actinoplanes awajinensis subsp. mycoplanecinus TaxID=135947 RepID=A0A101JCE3_9ACTN|nr:hypothetical protein ADL15_44170 [Actinoplanes awajinensis subsp. mycoplanecinus]